MNKRKMSQMTFLIISFIINITINSCSSYINRIHNGFDRQKERSYRAPKSKNNFDFFRNARSQKRRGSKWANNSTGNKRFLAPKVKRNYQKGSEIKKRYRDYDLNDNGTDGSLWIDASGSATQLFAHDSRRKIGNIVVINVYKDLKSEITAELKRAFPSPRRKKKKDKAKTIEEPKKEESTAPSNKNTSKKALDKISSIIVEEINRTHILLRGRKNILFKNRKHIVEIQALISRKNISLDDTVNSDDILESEVNIIR